MMVRKKIAFYIESMIVGGAEKVLIDYANNINPDLYEVSVIALFKKSVYSNYIYQFEEGFNSNVKYRFLIDNTNATWYKFFNFLYSKLNHRFIYRWLVREKFDIEIAFYEGWPTEFVAASHQSSLKIAWLHTHQERLYRDMSLVKKENLFKIYQSFQKIIAVSDAVSASFSEVFPKLGPQTVYNPFNVELIRTKANEPVLWEPDPNIVNLVTVGRLIEIKGHKRLIQALAKCRDQGYGFSLIMIGDGELKNELRELVTSLNLNQQIKFLGHLNNPYPYMKNADCLVCSSFAEGLNTVVIESVISGTPFLTTDCGGMKEIVNKTGAGIICQNSEEGLFILLIEILKNPFQLKNLKKNTLPPAEFFRNRNRLRELEDIFGKLLQQN